MASLAAFAPSVFSLGALPRLHKDAYDGNLSGVLECINQGQDVNDIVSLKSQNAHIIHKVTPLFLAAQIGNTEICKLLIEKGADPSLASCIPGTPQSCTPAQVARTNFRMKLADYLEAATKQLCTPPAAAPLPAPQVNPMQKSAAAPPLPPPVTAAPRALPPPPAVQPKEQQAKNKKAAAPAKQQVLTPSQSLHTFTFQVPLGGSTAFMDLPDSVRATMEAIQAVQAVRAADAFVAQAALLRTKAEPQAMATPRRVEPVPVPVPVPVSPPAVQVMQYTAPATIVELPVDLAEEVEVQVQEAEVQDTAAHVNVIKDTAAVDADVDAVAVDFAVKEDHVEVLVTSVAKVGNRKGLEADSRALQVPRQLSRHLSKLLEAATAGDAEAGGDERQGGARDALEPVRQRIALAC